jgi:hypothetical protein|tara:strand:+ start:2069 stop:2512 length:444 start_codon:yes stop_codon:yes gene_type:complete
MLYSFNKAEPKELPFKIYLSNGKVRTDPSSFSDDEIADAGYVYAGFAPAHDTATQKATWDGTAWVISNKTTEELQAEKDVLWKEIREQRDQKINEFEWRISRYLSETRQGINPTTDTISDLDSYVQDLRNITKQTDPSNITWPTIPS